MNKNQHPIKHLKTLVAVLAVVASLLFGTISPASAAEPAHAVAAVSSLAAPTQIGATVNGTTICKGAVTAGYKSMYVAAFALGFCPTWGFFQTSWGRQVGNWVTNVACRMPWFVWAATGGRWTRC